MSQFTVSMVTVQVRKAFVQTIIAMAYHGYLELEGGELMVEFVVKQCALPDEVTVSHVEYLELSSQFNGIDSWKIFFHDSASWTQGS